MIIVSCDIDSTLTLLYVSFCSQVYLSAINESSGLLDSAFEEIKLFIEENEWFNEINEFCNSWNVASKLNLKGAQAFNIEVNY